jgi:hypothetical protein
MYQPKMPQQMRNRTDSRPRIEDIFTVWANRDKVRIPIRNIEQNNSAIIKVPVFI